MSILLWSFALCGSYLIGSIPTAYLIVKRLKGIDVRSVGSGNAGATNVARAAGTKAGLVVFLLDGAKGAIAVLVFARWLQPATPAVQLGVGLAAVLGHIFPVFLKFRGGKGVATSIGVIAGTDPALAGLCALVWLVCVGWWRHVSVGSMAAAAALPIGQLMLRRPLSEVLLGAVLALAVIVKHHSNIRRLLQDFWSDTSGVQGGA
ncbi:MAG: glycerol-3-phosphate 1-O-acyltransferase PlsY, partial [Gemmatimonadetes bacterium]|nr:glycerol-3-phosphate 1-O-acyltransferase PlsY [Gemmatimonadota bacterium]